ncbi:MAG: XRE family transcriptional regulator [Treponema sp.]|jgi:transcriptional regulator with XRE-family HTH domain|nr:XRE family transcriptional regulator [Treponema sp.]
MVDMAVTTTPGERIIELCKTYSISRETLAERSGLPIELIRRIEEEGHIPGLAPLLKISRALGVRLGALLDDHAELGPVITRTGTAGAAARFVTGIPSGEAPAGGAEPRGLSFKTLAADKGGRHMEPFIVDIESHSEQAKSSHEGEEFIYVLSGAITLEYGSDTHRLDQGDSVYYDSIVPHRVLPAAAQQAQILAVIYSPA